MFSFAADEMKGFAMLHFGLRCYSVDQCAMSHAQNKSTSIKSFEGKTNISAYEKALVCFPKRNVVTSNGKTVKPVCACVLASAEELPSGVTVAIAQETPGRQPRLWRFGSGSKSLI